MECLQRLACGRHNIRPCRAADFENERKSVYATWSLSFN